MVVDLNPTANSPSINLESKQAVVGRHRDNILWYNSSSRPGLWKTVPVTHERLNKKIKGGKGWGKVGWGGVEAGVDLLLVQRHFQRLVKPARSNTHKAVCVQELHQRAGMAVVSTHNHTLNQPHAATQTQEFLGETLLTSATWRAKIFCLCGSSV
ncbi:hypothetical protein RRG08_022184 [Elysia crispata]|uniref:Uncharacterized protein n=1 Tax=Elysia crispata TaxID=231223 RepID=A0AAE1CZQ5_9GAST|nr:hypothetical protein RRG08_022184 [Elysia crispata]